MDSRCLDYGEGMRIGHRLSGCAIGGDSEDLPILRFQGVQGLEVGAEEEEGEGFLSTVEIDKTNDFRQKLMLMAVEVLTGSLWLC